MPLHWTIDTQARMLSARAEGDVSFDEALGLLDALSAAKALGYRKLFDGRGGGSAMTGDELLALCARVREVHGQGPMGPLAMVATASQTWIFARLLGALAAADRPIKVFDDEKRAWQWICAQAEVVAAEQGPVKNEAGPLQC